MENEKFVILNETALNRLGFNTPSDALGAVILLDDENYLEVLGVVKDFIYSNTSNPIGPLVLRLLPQNFRYANIKVASANIESTIQFLEEKWKVLDPERPFQYKLYTDQLRDYFANAESMLKGIGFLAFLAIFIAFFGLLGMVIFDTESKIKEIGIRKVLGAEAINIVMVISKSFIYLLLLASVLAIPAAWFINNLFLQNFHNRIELGPGTFAIGIILVFVLGIIIVFSQTIKAANANPVDTLRSE